MKNLMKKAAILSFTIAVFAFVFSSCQPYEDGPSISLRSKTNRITGDWVVKEVLVNGTIQDISSFSPEYTFNSDGTGSFSVLFFNMRISVDAEWELTNNGENIKIRTKDEDLNWEAWEEYLILKLYYKEMAIEMTYFDDDEQANLTRTVTFERK